MTGGATALTRIAPSPRTRTISASRYHVLAGGSFRRTTICPSQLQSYDDRFDQGRGQFFDELQHVAIKRRSAIKFCSPLATDLSLRSDDFRNGSKADVRKKRRSKVMAFCLSVIGRIYPG